MQKLTQYTIEGWDPDARRWSREQAGVDSANRFGSREDAERALAEMVELGGDYTADSLRVQTLSRAEPELVTIDEPRESDRQARHHARLDQMKLPTEVQRSILRITEAAGGADWSKSFLDVPFEAAPDVGSIEHRLAPLDVGFDLRAQGGMAIDLGCEERLRVSYADERGERRVMSGPRAEVVARLEGLGFRVVGG